MTYAIYQKSFDDYELSFSNGVVFGHFNEEEISMIECILQAIGIEETTPNYMS